MRYIDCCGYIDFVVYVVYGTAMVIYLNHDAIRPGGLPVEDRKRLRCGVLIDKRGGTTGKPIGIGWYSVSLMKNSKYS